jgi:hypothetical protein
LYRARGLLVRILMATAGPAPPNDSAAEMSIGGLQFVRTNDVAMESEDLHIALERISVRYKFTNLTTKPVTLTVAFPLPDIDMSEAESIALPSIDPVNFVEFETMVDGSPAPLAIEQRAIAGNKDVSALLRELKLPLLPLGSREIRVADLPAATRIRLVDDGLLMPAGMSDNGRQQYVPGWITRTSAVRQQVFQPMRTVTVEHQYRPSVGSSPDTILRSNLRHSSALGRELARYRKEYCIQDAFLAEIDKRAGSSQANTANLQERRISYVLKTGANWAAPIRSFKLTISPGGSDRLVSFCPGRLKPSATGNTLEYTASDFTPVADLKILVIGKF